MNKKSLTLILAILLCLAMSLVGCKKDTIEENVENQPGDTTETTTTKEEEDTPKEKVKISVMYQNNGETDNYKKWMDENIELFMEQNEYIEVESLSTVSGDQYLTKVNTLMAANATPDIFEGWVSGRLEPFVEAGILYEIGKEFENDPEFKEFLNQEALKATTFDGKVYSLPSTIHGEYVIYNKNVFDQLKLEEPKTYDDFLNIVEVCKANEIIPVALCNRETWTGTIPYMILFDRFGGIDAYNKTIVNREGKFTDDAFVKAGEMLQEWMDIGVFEEGVNGISYADAEAKFVEGKAAMWFIGSFINGPMEEKLGRENVGMFNFPEIPGGAGSVNNWVIIPNQSISISENSENKEEAVAFVKFIFSQERQEALAKLGYITCTNVELDASELSPLVVEFNDSLGSATGSINPWDVSLGNYLGKELNNATQLMYAGENVVKILENLQVSADSESN